MGNTDDARPKNRRRRRGRLLALGLVAAAVATELRKPPAERTWEGRVAGLVPYDLRVPTIARARQRLWNEDDQRLMVPTVFGVGWTVNFARAAQILRS